MSMSSVVDSAANPWLSPAAEVVDAGAETVDEVVSVPWPPGAEVEVGRRLDRVEVSSSGLWVVAAHGGAGASTVASLLGGGDAGVAWPEPTDRGRACVIVVARTHSHGISSAKAAAIEWACQ